MRIPKKLLYYMQDLAVHPFFTYPVGIRLSVCFVSIFYSGALERICVGEAGFARVNINYL